MAIVEVGAIRGARNVEGKLFVVAGNGLYQITNAGVAVLFGTIPGIGRVSMAHNQRGLGNELAIANGSSGYVFDTQSQLLAKITDTGFAGATIFDYVDQYIPYVEPQGRFWGHSDLADAKEYNTLDRYEAEADPDKIVGLLVSHREVLVFGRDTIEPFVNTGGQTGTFERASNTVIEVGCSAKFTPRKLDSTAFWLDDKRLIRRLVNGYTAEILSTGPIAAAFEECSEAEISQAYAFTWEPRGHKVYYITVPGRFTFGYDVKTGLWHRRATNGLPHWAVSEIVYWNGKWIACDSRYGRLYELDERYKWDGQDELIRELTTGKLWDEQNELTLNSVELLFKVGGKLSEKADFPVQPVGPSISGDAPNGEVNVEHPGVSYAVTPGDAPITSVKVVSGTLPPPATMSNAGVIAPFAPTTPGTYAYQVRAKDANQLIATLSDTIVISPPQYDDDWKYKVEAPGSEADYSSPDYDDSDWDVGPGGFGSYVPIGSTLTVGTDIPPVILQSIWLRRELTFGGRFVLDVFHDDGEELWLNGQLVELEDVQYFHSRATLNLQAGDVIALKVTDGVPAGSLNIFAGISFTAADS